MKKTIALLVAAALACGVYFFINAQEKSDASQTAANEKVIEDIPAQLEYAKIPNGRKEQIIVHTGFTVSYNSEWNIPNWVAYEFSEEETHGDQERCTSFTPDPMVKGDPVQHYDYSNSGYDRGHMAPAADMRWSVESMTESFYTTNICPQNHNLNSKSWNNLEQHVRYLASRSECIYVCTGPIVENTDQTIGRDRKIVVPQAFFKVLLRQDKGEWKAIGFVMENKSEGTKLGIAHFARTIDEIEQQTGIDFFYNLPDSVENDIEAGYDLRDWRLQ